jgi:hypothetical protein
LIEFGRAAAQLRDSNQESAPPGRAAAFFKKAISIDRTERKRTFSVTSFLMFKRSSDWKID